jgi:hypothetical protein
LCPQLSLSTSQSFIDYLLTLGTPDEYRACAKCCWDRISEREHIFFLLNGVAHTDEWETPELRLIKDSNPTGGLAEAPNAVVKKLWDPEDEIKSSKGISSEVALATCAGTVTSEERAKRTEKKSAKRGDTRTCYFGTQRGHIKRHCPEQKGTKNTETTAAETSDTEISDTEISTRRYWTRRSRTCMQKRRSYG